MSEKENNEKRSVHLDFSLLNGFWAVLMLTLFFSYTCNTGAVLKTSKETYWVGCSKEEAE